MAFKGLRKMLKFKVGDLVKFNTEEKYENKPKELGLVIGCKYGFGVTVYWLERHCTVTCFFKDLEKC